MTEGQCVVVQVQKEARADKGAKLVRAIQIPGTYLVYRPFGSYIDVSTKIADEEKAEELRRAVMQNVGAGQEGWVVRTAAADVDTNVVVEEMNELRGVYDNIRIKARSASAPALLFAKENPLFELIRRYRETLQTVVVNDHNLEDKVKAIFSGEVKFDKDPSETFGIQDMLQTAMEKTVKLPSGGEIHIEETSAFVAIDVDSAGWLPADRQIRLIRKLPKRLRVKLFCVVWREKLSLILPVRPSTALCAA